MPYEESDSCRVLISRARGIEHAATAVHLSSGMSVQLDIPIFVLVLPPLQDVGLVSSCRGLASACSFFMSRKGWMSHLSGSYTLCSPFSLACKDKMEDFHPI